MSGTRAWKDNLSARLLWLCLILLAAALFAQAIPNPPYSPDSWTYWDLAKSIFGQFYEIPGLRAYQSTLPWSQAFPPLWPALNAVVAALLGTGPITLLITNAVVLVLFAATSAAASRALFSASTPGLVAAILMLGDPSWRIELLAGRPIPLQMTFLAATAATLAAPPSPRRYLLAGFFCGLMLTTKFDAAPLVATLAAYLLLAPGCRYLPLFLLAAAIPPLPWAWFSLTHFGRPFASDGSLIAAIIDPLAATTDFRLDWRPTLRDDPAAWFRKLAPHLSDLYWDFRKSLSTTELATVALATLAAIPGIVRRPRAVLAPNAALLTAIALGLAAMFASYVATGFIDPRYYAPIRWFAALVALGLACRALSAPFRPAIAALGLVLAVLTATGLRLQTFGWRPAPGFEHPPAIAALAACLDRIAPTKLLVLDDDNLAARYAALTGHPAGMVPANFDRLDPATLHEFIARYGFGAITWSTDRGAERARRLDPAPIPGCDQAAQLQAARP